MEQDSEISIFKTFQSMNEHYSQQQQKIFRKLESYSNTSYKAHSYNCY